MQDAFSEPLCAAPNDSASVMPGGCLLCGQHDAALLLEKVIPVPELPQIEVVRCQHCRHRYLLDWPRTLELALYDYYADRLGWPRERVYTDLTTDRYIELFRELEAKVAGRSLLDVGCGAGHLVSVASSRGWNAHGIDTSPSAVAVARGLGSKVNELDFFSDCLNDQRFDVVVMTEVLEHVPRPLEFLRRACRLLVPGGVLYLTTPNFNSLTRRVVGPAWSPIHPEHISYFVTSVLERAARDAGFDAVRLESRNTSPGLILERLRGEASQQAVCEESTTSPATEPAEVDPTQRLRRRIRESRVLTKLLAVANVALNLAQAGDTLVLWATRSR